jgi:hypothetical protein
MISISVRQPRDTLRRWSCCLTVVSQRMRRVTYTYLYTYLIYLNESGISRKRCPRRDQTAALTRWSFHLCPLGLRPSRYVDNAPSFIEGAVGFLVRRFANWSNFRRVRNNLIMIAPNPVIAASSSTEWLSTSLNQISVRFCEETFESSWTTKSCCSS